MTKRILAAAMRNLGFLCIAGVLLYCVIHAFDPPRLNWGDSASDYNAMTAGRNFQKYGFLALKLTPHVLDPAVMTTADSALIYTHYPQLPDVMNGVLRTAFGMTDLVQFRFVALLFSFSALIFVYRLIAMYWSRDVAQIALGLWVVNPLWIQHADYLHHLPYASFFGFGSLYFLATYLGGGGKRRDLALSGVFMFFVFLASYDFWIFTPLLAALITFGHTRRVSAHAARTLGVLAICAVCALFCKWGTNAWVLGGLSAFVHDMRFQLVERATNKAVKVHYADGVWPTAYGRIERFFSLLLFPVLLFWLTLPALRRRWQKIMPGLEHGVVNPILILFAALPFLAVFTELWIGQYYPTLLVLPFYAIGSAALAVLLARSGRIWPTRIGILIVGVLFANSFAENLSFDKAYFDRSAIASLGANLDTLAEPGQQILTDHVFDAAYRYYFSHNTVALFLNPPARYEPMIRYYADPRLPRVAPARGALFVHHKHLTDELYDKGYYYILGRAGLWGPWGNPEEYRSELDTFIAARDSELLARVAEHGDKIVDTKFYEIWRLRPVVVETNTTLAALHFAPLKHETHLAKVER